MGFVIGLLIGVALGAIVVYFLTTKRTSALAAAVQDLQRQLKLAESEHDRRLRATSDRLRQDYETQLKATQAKLAAMAAQMTPPPAPASVPTEPLPAPVPAPPVAVPPAIATAAEATPQTPTSPVTATAPAPIPQPMGQNPAVPQPAPPPVASVAARPAPPWDPNTLLAASYAPEAALRCEVAQQIGAALSTGGTAAQARWLPMLTRLARDGDPAVRLHAVQALGGVKPTQRLPLLRRALYDTDPTVVETATQLLSQSKTSLPAKPKPAKRRLPKNR